MFDLGFSELFLIGVVALIVLGPERLPKAARTVGLLLRRARNSYVNLKSDIERELAADELKRSLKSVSEPAQSVKQAFDEARQGGRDFQASLMQSDRAKLQAEVDSALPAAPAKPEQASPAPTQPEGSDHPGQRRTGDIGKLARPAAAPGSDSEPPESSA